MKTPLFSIVKRSFIWLLIAAFLNMSVPVNVQAQEFVLPKPGVMVRTSPPMNPPVLKGLKISTTNPFRFDFILDKGDVETRDPSSLQEESQKLIKYFLASLTIPEKDLWVNLSPYEKERIIPESFGVTEMGRDLLAEDYLLKQITASLIYPEDEVGRKFWKRVYEEAQAKFHTTNIPVNTFNKVWIVPDEAVVYENDKAGTAFVVESRLKVMLETDYLSASKNVAQGGGIPPLRNTDVNDLGKQIVREIVIPELTKEVNEGKNFARLRQVYNSLILAAWYKKKLKDSVLSQVYADRSKTAGIAIDPQEKEKIYQQYVTAFKKGVYNFIKEEADPNTNERIPRKYFSGGVEFDKAMRVAMKTVPSVPAEKLKGDFAQITADCAVVSESESPDASGDSAMISKEFIQAFFGKQLTKDEMRRAISGNMRSKDFYRMIRAYRMMVITIAAIAVISGVLISNYSKKASRDYTTAELVTMTKGRSVENRRLAVEELARHAKEPDVMSALKFALQDKDAQVRAEAARSLVVIYNQEDALKNEIERALLPLAGDQDTVVRMNAMQGLKKVNRQNINVWVKGLDDPSAEMVQVCVSNIRGAMDKRLTQDDEEWLADALKPYAKSSNAAVRLLAVESFKDGSAFYDVERAKETLTLLIEAVKDEDPNVAEAAKVNIQEFSRQFITVFNDRHEISDRNTRFAEVLNFNSDLLYHILYYSKDANIYTSTFKNLFGFLLERLDKEKTSGYELLQAYRAHENPRQFLTLLTQYRPALGDFMSRISEAEQKDLMNGFMSGLDKVASDKLFAEGALIAEALHTFRDNPQELLSFRDLLLAEQARVSDVRVKKVYNVLAGMIPNKGIFGPNWVQDMEKKFGIRNLDNIPMSSLTDAQGRVIIRHVFAYNDESSLDDSRNNYASFREIYGKSPNWSFEENRRKGYVVIRSKGIGPQVIMFANIPLSNRGYNEDFDNTNGALERVMESMSAVPVGVFVRGHQYVAAEVVERDDIIKGKEAFVILGNCGGAGLFDGVLKRANNASLAGTYSTGYRVINNSIMQTITGMVSSNTAVDFPTIKTALDTQFVDAAQFEYVFLPSDVQLVFLTIMYRDNAMTAIQDNAEVPADLAQASFTKGGIDLNIDQLNLKVQKGSGTGIKFEIDPQTLQQLKNAPGLTPNIIKIQPLNNLPVFLGLQISDAPMRVG